ncbi:hypothetical protein D3C72_1753330 [compost metagenome]
MSQLSSAPPCPSKNDQVLRASSLRNWSWEGDNAFFAATGGRPSRQAIAGMMAHKASTGKAACQADGFQRKTQAPIASASRGDPQIESSHGPERVPPSRLVMLDGFHSNRRRREIVSRYSVRQMASRL